MSGGVQACCNYYNILLLSPQGCCCWKGGGGSASQQPLLCRIHAVKLWLFKREKQKATAPLLNIVSFPSVSFSFYLPFLLCLIVLLFCLHSLPHYLLADKRLAVWGERGEHPVYHPQQERTVLAHSKGDRGGVGWSPKCPDFPSEKGTMVREQDNVYGRRGWTSEGNERFYTPAHVISAELN